MWHKAVRMRRHVWIELTTQSLTSLENYFLVLILFQCWMFSNEIRATLYSANGLQTTRYMKDNLGLSDGGINKKAEVSCFEQKLKASLLDSEELMKPSKLTLIHTLHQPWAMTQEKHWHSNDISAPQYPSSYCLSQLLYTYLI